MTAPQLLTLTVLLLSSPGCVGESVGADEFGDDSSGAEPDTGADAWDGVRAPCFPGEPGCECARESVPYVACTYTASVCVAGQCTSCEPGTEGCSCTSLTGCEPGLACVSGECS